VIIFLTISWIITVIGLDSYNAFTTRQLAWAVVIIFQNLIMLLLTPLLLKKFKIRAVPYNLARETDY
jgi:hypothetical protein